MDKSTILNLVLESLDESLESMDGFDNSRKPPLAGSTRLIGRQSLLSSIALVSMIVGIEEKLAENHDVLITIADERAMSMEKSPFRTVESLTDYVSILISEQN